jgi:Cu(I)/Ag(I) efflux system membrane protein CusA/SilA
VEGLPAGVTPRMAADAPATGQIFWYSVEGGQHDLGRLRALHDSFIRPQLASVPGVAEVASVGGVQEQFQVDFDPERLQAYQIALDDALAAVSASHAVVGGQVVQKSGSEFIVRSAARLGASADIADQSFDAARAVRDLESIVLPRPVGGSDFAAASSNATAAK